MRRAMFLSCLLLLAAGGCAASQPAHSVASAADANVDDNSVASLSRKQADEHARITELEARIALLEAEARRNRGSAATPKQVDTIRIGAARPQRHAAEPVEGERRDENSAVAIEGEPPRRSSERLPTLRLYGAPHEASSELPAADTSLSVVPLPEDRAKALAQGDAGAADATLTAEYRNGLRLLREQRYDDALAAFESFVTQHPEHALAASALYWRGEAHYAKREYQKAREAFDALLARFGQSDKIPDALVKVGLCLRRLGDEAQAQAYFRRVREKYPNTQAAVIAAREGST